MGMATTPPTAAIIVPPVSWLAIGDGLEVSLKMEVE